MNAMCDLCLFPQDAAGRQGPGADLVLVTATAVLVAFQPLAFFTL